MIDAIEMGMRHIFLDNVAFESRARDGLAPSEYLSSPELNQGQSPLPHLEIVEDIGGSRSDRDVSCVSSPANVLTPSS